MNNREYPRNALETHDKGKETTRHGKLSRGNPSGNRTPPIPRYLKERSFLRSQCGGDGFDKHVLGSHGTSFGGSRLLVGQKLVANLGQIFFGENETHILHDVRKYLR